MTSAPAPPSIPVPNVGADLEKYIGKYVQLRAMIKKLDDEHAAKMAPYKQMLELLENGFLNHLNTTGSDSASVRDVGTIYKKERKSASIADGAEFRRFIIGSEAWDLVDWRANAPQIASFVSKNGAVPGVNYSTSVGVGVRKS